MDTRTLYNQWSATYDKVENKTRDLEGEAGQKILSSISFENVLELGCGTGKNTEWLSQKAKHLLAVDLSEEMMAKAKEKVSTPNVRFQQADITQPWSFTKEKFDLVTCSLILEHIEDLNFIFEQASSVLQSGGHFYICELHPYKQYSGSKARFETNEGLQVLECFMHHASDYFNAAMKNVLTCECLDEWFDKNDRSKPPRLISFLFRKK
ncbi:class I SAM-dependent DNA methyltransferase [Flavisolibacter ginsenosidimutans]|uniref:Class I SAM-dependent methyltransferase n=1 Tax=Flavisolibacter ginsenosidimutans TaxID=661481 RepID=A0A5B8UME3_9BACT|nr:class I SAM-dependent methyltransferase [Flavisolibacter ginsenosidimutans]QEC57532.1 class I SAM-dependent methyltransferase [Flavisolibacter ginsenosidimutans]